MARFPGGNSGVTTVAWFKQDAPAGHPGKAVVGVGDSGTGAHFFLRVCARTSDAIWDGPDDQNRLWIGVDNGSLDKWWASNAVIDASVWYQAATTYSPEDRTVRMYINGALDRTITLEADLSLTDAFFIGLDAYNDSPFNGTIDQVRIYGRPLHALEIAQLYDTDCLEGYNNGYRAGIAKCEGSFSQEELDQAISDATSGLFTQEQLDQAVANATSSLFTQEQLDQAVADATSGLFTQTQIDQAVAAAEAARDLIINQKDQAISDLNAAIAEMYTNEELTQEIAAILTWGDLNNDGKIGLEEAIRALRIAADAQAQ